MTIDNTVKDKNVEFLLTPVGIYLLLSFNCNVINEWE